jgi:hypothetical protein
MNSQNPTPKLHQMITFENSARSLYARAVNESSIEGSKDNSLLNRSNLSPAPTDYKEGDIIIPATTDSGPTSLFKDSKVNLYDDQS